MKKTLIITVLLFLIGGISISCKKNWTCQCEPENNINWSVEHFPIENQTKKDAAAKCKESNTEELDCTLK